MKFSFRKKHYDITPDRNEWVAPEETLVDAGSAVGDIELPVSDGIFRGATVLMVVLMVILGGAVVRLTLLRHTDFAELALRNRTINVSVPPPRGLILDRNGIPLVQNVPSFDLLVVSRQVRRAVDGTFPDLIALAQALNQAPEPMALVLADGVRTNAVFFLATDLSRSQVLALRSTLPPGFSIITSTKRQYVSGGQFSTIIGYVGKVNTTDMARDPYYLPSDTVGRLGVEASYEEILRGDHGQLVFEVRTGMQSQMPTDGDNVVLTVDADIQKALFSSLWDMLREAGLSEAAAVVQNPRDGAVLGMVSFPTYDNNVFTGQLSQEDFQRLFLSSQRPLFNRAIAGTYNPGSTIKPLIGMMALQEDLVGPHQILVNDCVNLVVPNPADPEHPYIFNNWRADTGSFDLFRAIAQSCNVYFFTLGGGHGSFSGLGVQRIDDYLKKSFADILLRIDLPGEDAGFVPTPEWKYAEKKEPWYQGDTYNISIGQGDLSVTPLWLNAYTAAIANGGTVWQPRVASRIVDDQRSTVSTIPAQALGTLPFDAHVIGTMQAAMRETVRSGTAKILQDVGVAVAAKTGTAEVVKGQRINSFLTVFAPADNPQIALTVLIEGSASNQGYALRAARQFLQWYFSPKLSPTPLPTQG